MTKHKSDLPVSASLAPPATPSTAPRDLISASYPSIEEAVRRDVQLAGVTTFVPAFLEAEVAHGRARVQAAAALVPESMASVRRREAKRELRHRRRRRDALRLEAGAAQAEAYDAMRDLAGWQPPRTGLSRTGHAIVFGVAVAVGAAVVSLCTAPAFAAQDLGVDLADLLGVEPSAVCAVGAFLLGCLTCGAKGALALLFSRRLPGLGWVLFGVHVAIAFATAVFRAGGGAFGFITYALAMLEIGIGVIFLGWGWLLAEEFADRREAEDEFAGELHRVGQLGQLSAAASRDAKGEEAACDVACDHVATLDEAAAREARDLRLASTTATTAYVTETMRLAGEALGDDRHPRAINNGGEA